MAISSETYLPRVAQPAPAWSVALGGMIAMAGAVGISRFVYTPILPVMAEALNLSKSAAGLIASANFLGYLVGALLAAVGSMPAPRRLWLVSALAASGVTSAAMGSVSTLPGFMLLRFVGGGASAFVLVFASALVFEWLAEARRPYLAAVHFAGVGIGIIVSSIAISSGLAHGADWQSLWLGVGGIVLVSCLPVAALIPAEPPPGFVLPPSAAAGHSSGLGWLIGAYGLFGFGYVISATFLVAIVRASPEMRSTEALVWLLVGLAATPSVVLWSRLATAIGTRRAYSVACLTEAIGVAASVLWPTAGGAILSAVLLGGTFMGLTSLGLAEARAQAPTNPRPAMALMTAAFGLGQVIGPALAGFLSDLFGSYELPSLLAAAGLIVGALIVQIRPATRTL